MSDDNIVKVDFPKGQPREIAGLTPAEVNALMAVAYSRITKPVMGCLLVFWDADGVMSVSDNRGQSYTPDQLNWMTYGMAHLKGRGVVNSTSTGGPVLPEGA